MSLFFYFSYVYGQLNRRTSCFVHRIDEVADDVVVRFDDGSECVFHDPDVERLIPAEDSSLFPDEEQCAYFPGLVVHASTSALRSATWTRGRTNR